ncbi:iduronate-2-sulfatase [Oceaniferula spumae]|uniref:Iduronate-2-sulfatase n=1 Tax=Oceaniferula spumae TaxID=2979115 RepID=A0AAT9FGH2_9BACT
MIKKWIPLAVFAGLAIGTSMAAEKPNVLFIAVDDLKPDLGNYGNTLVKTPNFDRLAAMGVTFTNSHCNQAVCGPSRASLMTGLRPDRTRVHDLKTVCREVSPWITTIPEHFKNNGYVSVGTGKIYDPRCVDKKSDEPSWSRPFRLYNLDYNDQFPEPVAAAYQGAAFHQALKEMTAEGKKGYGPIYKGLVKRDLHPAVESVDVPDDAYTDGAIRKQGVKYLRELGGQGGKEKPFFVAVGFKKPHLPFVAPKKYWDMYNREDMPLAEFKKHAENSPDFAYHNFPELRSYSGIPAEGPLSDAQSRELIHGYYACISYIDAQIGMLLDELEQRDLMKNTIIVVWGDHGWHLGDHGLWAKHTNYEQSTRAPLMFAGPGIQKGKSSAAPTEFVDIFPTLCDLAGIPQLENLDGQSAKPILDGSKEQVDDYAVSQFGRGKAMGYAFRDKQYRYIVWVNGDKASDGTTTPAAELGDKVKAEELYDYKADPLETKNIIKDPEQAERVKALRATADNFLKQQHSRIAKQTASAK